MHIHVCICLCVPYSKWSTWNMHVSVHFMRLQPVVFMHWISSDNTEEFTIPCMIPETCMQHSATDRDLGRFTGRYHACFMHELLPDISCMGSGGFYTWNMHISSHIPCMVLAYSMHGTGVFHAWYRHIPCMVQAYSMRGIGIFYAWYRRIPCMVQAYSMYGTGIFHAWCRHIPCVVQACVYHMWYRYSHAHTMYRSGSCTI